MKRLFIASCAAGALAASPAFADSVGTIVQVSGEQGSVVVLRSGQTIDATPSLELMVNDRVIVRADGSVDVSADGCSLSLTAPAMAVVNDDFCASQPTRLASTSSETPPAQTGGRSFSLGGAAAATSAAGASAIAIAAAAAGGSSGSAAGTTAALSDETTGSGGSAVASGSGGTTSGPETGLVSSTFDPGSGLDVGLFGFFESTSS